MITFHKHFLLDTGSGSGGVSQAELDEAQAHFTDAKAQVNAAKGQGELAFANLLTANNTEIKELADKIANQFSTVIVSGIGGSDLGARAVHRALNHQFYNLDPKFRQGRPRLFFAGDTTDPVALQEIIDTVNWAETAILFISKSGNTIEPTSAFLVLREELIKVVGEDTARSHIFTVTDPRSGTLRTITDQEGYRSIPHPEAGGRFSVLSAVGLLPVAIAGVNIDQLLAGARWMDEQQEMAAEYALLQYLAYTKHGQHISVLMPYTYSLREVGFWFRQLWAESLGKRENVHGQRVELGTTPVAALGPTDQHSQVQLYQEGARDKVITFITVTHPATDRTLPDSFPNQETVHYLAGHGLQEILLIEQQATAKALAEDGRPSGLLELEKLDAFHLGALLYFFELATAYAGALFEINPYNQPGVERGKEIIHELLGD